MSEIKGKISAPLKVRGKLSMRPTISAKLTVPLSILPPAYEGSYEVTPSKETQTLRTEELYMLGDVTINPIPNNYGLIEWDGRVITVS